MRFSAFSSALIFSHMPLAMPALRASSSPKTCGWRRIIFVGDGLDHVAEGEFAQLFGHPRVIDDLQQQVAELVAQIVQVAARDGVGDLVGFLDRVGSDGLESPARRPRGSR